jgi:hypothetical protein
MNYITPEQIKEYVSKNPTGIAGNSKELSEMVNHFAKLIVEECILKAHGARIRGESMNDLIERIRSDFGVDEHEWFDEDPPC